MIRRIVVAAVAVVAGLAVAGGLLLYDRSGQAAEEVYSAATDLPSGAHLGGGSVRLVRAVLGSRQSALAYRAGEEVRLSSTLAAHELTAGQIIQRSDTVSAGQETQRALVAVPLRDAPPLRAGDHIDLLAISGTGELLAVSVFAAAVEVHSVTGAGVVLEVAAGQAPGFVYAAAAMRLVAVRVPAGPPGPDPAPITSSQQARAAVRR